KKGNPRRHDGNCNRQPDHPSRQAAERFLTEWLARGYDQHAQPEADKPAGCELQQAIMNIPCKYSGGPGAWAYDQGHRHPDQPRLTDAEYEAIRPFIVTT
ncbi:MAG TPA: hypothetical protein VFV87_14295, partial [Pirellulaceae bacterium]|nr:hypothetical protein [Pirellulaceae bacterium]